MNLLNGYRTWTKNYARDIALVQADKVKKLMDMGFTETQAKEALEKYGWDEDSAVNSLLGS